MLQTLANTMENERFELKTVANTMENERFELKTVANTMEMAVSSSKMLQIAWEMVRTGNKKKIPKQKKKNHQTISYPLKFIDTRIIETSSDTIIIYDRYIYSLYLW